MKVNRNYGKIQLWQVIFTSVVGITGAIVNRQPFGGMKLSAFGGGVKAGGPNYCACFVNIADKSRQYHRLYTKLCEGIRAGICACS